MHKKEIKLLEKLENLRAAHSELLKLWNGDMNFYGELLRDNYPFNGWLGDTYNGVVSWQNAVIKKMERYEGHKIFTTFKTQFNNGLVVITDGFYMPDTGYVQSNFKIIEFWKKSKEVNELFPGLIKFGTTFVVLKDGMEKEICGECGEYMLDDNGKCSDANCPNSN